MSRLRELIAELCPDGVEYRPLSELFDIRNGYTPSKRNSEFWENGTHPWFVMEDIRRDGTVLSESAAHITDAALKKNGLFPANSIIVATSATIGVHALVTVDFLCNQRFACMTIKQRWSELLDIRYVHQVFFALDRWCMEHVDQGNFATVNSDALKAYCIPVPPIEVQREIVRILDSFRELDDALTDEIEAREKQLTSVLGNIALTTENASQGKKLRKSCVIGRGNYITKKDVVPGKIPVVMGGLQPAYYHSVANHFGEAIVISRSGMNAGFSSFWDQPIFVSDGFVADGNGTDVLKYVFYALHAMQRDVDLLRRGSGVPHVNGQMLGELLLYVPDVDEQVRWVDKLDTISALIISLESEREARRKQFAYYRDKLLAFPRKGDSV